VGDFQVTTPTKNGPLFQHSVWYRSIWVEVSKKATGGLAPEGFGILEHDPNPFFRPSSMTPLFSTRCGCSPVLRGRILH
jgi:hypothetical protein